MAEGIVLLEEHDDGAVGLVAEDAGNAEARVRRSPECGSGSERVKPLGDASCYTVAVYRFWFIVDITVYKSRHGR